MFLKDIQIAHTKKSRIGKSDRVYQMHPFENSKGPNSGKYEVIRDIKEHGKVQVKRSTHVTTLQLAELYARGIMETYGFRLRLRPDAGDYDGPPPGKKVPRSCIAAGSNFAKLVSDVDRLSLASEELRDLLLRVNVTV